MVGSETALALAVAGGDEATTAALMLAEVVKTAEDLSCALTRVSRAVPVRLVDLGGCAARPRGTSPKV